MRFLVRFVSAIVAVFVLLGAAIAVFGVPEGIQERLEDATTREDEPPDSIAEGPGTSEDVPAPPMPPESEQLLGVQIHPFFDDQTDETVARELDLARSIGADTIRVDLVWSSLQIDGPGEFDADHTERVDRVLDGARDRGLRVVLMLWSTPCWASSAPESARQGCQGAWWERGVNAYPPRDPSTYGDVAEAVVRRWGDRIVALEVWNEPNFEFFLAGPNPPRDYGRMLRAAYPRIKAVRPDLPVLAGSLAHADGRFLKRMFSEGEIAGNYDAIAWHPYVNPGGPRAEPGDQPRSDTFAGGARWLRKIMRENGDARGELWATEAGAATCEEGANERCVDAATQARWIRDYGRIASRMPYLRALIFYNLRDNGTDPRDPEQGFGLVRRDFSPKPSLEEFKAIAARGDR